MSETLHGGCLCGSVRYRVPDAFEYAFNCHCSQCRRATGSAFKSVAGIRRDKVELERGHDQLLIHGDSSASHDVHCGNCGSLLFSVVREQTYAHVAMGTLEDEPAIRPSMHIFVHSKAAWHRIADDLPQHPGFP